MLCDHFDFSKWNVKKATLPNRLINYSQTKGTVDSIGPEFGANNEEIYCNLLGYNLKELERWKLEKII